MVLNIIETIIQNFDNNFFIAFSFFRLNRFRPIIYRPHIAFFDERKKYVCLCVEGEGGLITSY